MSRGGTVRLTFEKWAELEALRRANEEQRQAARLLRGQEELRGEIGRLRAELADAQRELADARRMHGDGDPAP